MNIDVLGWDIQRLIYVVEVLVSTGCDLGIDIIVLLRRVGLEWCQRMVMVMMLWKKDGDDGLFRYELTFKTIMLDDKLVLAL